MIESMTAGDHSCGLSTKMDLIKMDLTKIVHAIIIKIMTVITKTATAITKTARELAIKTLNFHGTLKDAQSAP